MAGLNNSFYATGGNPQWEYQISYTQTGRTSDTATYSVAVSIRMTNERAFYGYGLTGAITINGATDTIRIKNPSPSWSGTGWQGTWYFNIIAGAGTGGGTLPASINFYGTDGASSPNIEVDNLTVNVSTWNTAPYWDDNTQINVNGITQNSIFAENTGDVTVNLPSASDKEGNTIYYNVYRFVNGVNTAQVASNITDTSFTDNLAGSNQGDVITYKASISDGQLTNNDARWSYSYTINKLTGATLAPASIDCDTTSLDLSLTGASNTNGDTDFSYIISSNDITVYNGNCTSNSVTLDIWDGSGTEPTGLYIKKSDLVSFSQNSNFVCNLVINIQTNNAYGSFIVAQSNIAIDMRVDPTQPSAIKILGAYNISDTDYYIPNLTAPTVSWDASSNPLGASISYSVQLQYAGKDIWVTVANNLNSTKYTLDIPQLTDTVNISIKVIATTSYGRTSEMEVDNIRLDYWYPPKVSIKNINRSASQITAQIHSEVDTSIPVIAINSRYYYYQKAGTTDTNWVAFTGADAQITVDNLSDVEQGILVAQITDNSNIKGCTVQVNKNISPYIPILSVRKKGVGIGAFADDNNKFIVGGNATVNGSLTLKKDLTIGGAFKTNGELNINSDASITGNTTLNNANLTGTLNVNGEANFQSGVTFSNDLTMQNVGTQNLTVNGTTDLSGATTIESNFFVAGNYGMTLYDSSNSGDNTKWATISKKGDTGISVSNNFYAGEDVYANSYNLQGISGDYSYITASEDSNGVTTSRFVVGDDENDHVCLSVKHWQTGMKDVIDCTRDSITMNSDTTLNGSSSITGTTYVTTIQGLNNQQVNVEIDRMNAICFDAHSDRTQSRMWIDGHCSTNGHVEQELIPEGGSYGFIGNNSNYFYQMYACSFVNKSDRNVKTSITAYTDSALSKLKNMKVYLYSNIKKLSKESDIFKEDAQDLKLGVMAQEAPVEITGNMNFTGVDVYSLASFALKAIKEEVEIRERLEKKISEMSQQLLQIEKQLAIISQNNDKGADKVDSSMQKS